jgi:peptidyl-tRNA hydrolase, PTH1 family
VLRLVVGLGNPGSRYRSTRHNIGALVIDELVRRRGKVTESETARCRLLVSMETFGELALARPLVAMNHSGRAVRDLLDERGLTAEEMLVVCDDLHLPFGILRLRPRGSHGGHNGLRSVIACCGSGEFPRLRIGIGSPGECQAQEAFVLEPFAGEERARLPEVMTEAADCVDMALQSGIEQSMNRYNRKTDGATPSPAPAGG